MTAIATPKYQALSQRLIGEIRAGKLSEGERLAPERDLAITLGVSRITVRGAMAQLERAGYVERRQGSGTYVHARPSPPSSTPVQAEGTITVVYGQVHGDRSSDRFLGEFMPGLDACLHQKHLVPQFICQSVGRDPDARLQALPLRKGGRLLLCGYDPGSAFLRHALAAQWRIASLGTLASMVPGVTQITGMHEEAAYWATSHLIDHGYRRIALLNGPYTLPLSHERLAGYRRAHARRRVEIDDHLLHDQPIWLMESGRQLARCIVGGGITPDAVLCYGDWALVGLADELRRHGRNLGTDLPVIAGDWYSWLDDVVSNRLSGLHESREHLAQAAVAALDSGPEASGAVRRIPISLQLRDTCGCATRGPS
jgi:DNA-binding LacI/PurR family transcriptional regulator